MLIFWWLLYIWDLIMKYLICQLSLYKNIVTLWLCNKCSLLYRRKLFTWTQPTTRAPWSTPASPMIHPRASPSMGCTERTPPQSRSTTTLASDWSRGCWRATMAQYSPMDKPDVERVFQCRELMIQRLKGG